MITNYWFISDWKFIYDREVDFLHTAYVVYVQYSEKEIMGLLSQQ